MTNERVTANGFRPDATGFQVPSKHLIIGGTLFGVGCAICVAGIAVSGTGLLAAVQRWVADLERPPSEIAKGTWAQAKAAYAAGSAPGRTRTRLSPPTRRASPSGIRRIIVYVPARATIGRPGKGRAWRKGPAPAGSRSGGPSRSS